jgi:hypothetical protein
MMNSVTCPLPNPAGSSVFNQTLTALISRSHSPLSK